MLKLIDHAEAVEILDHLEKNNLLSPQSAVLARLIRDKRYGKPAPTEAHQDPVFRYCMTEADGNWDGFVWDFDKIMNYLRLSYGAKLAEVGL